MSRKDNLKKYGNMLHQAATKAAPNEEVTEPSESLSHKGVFPDTLDEDEGNNNLFKGVFPDTIED